LFIIYVIALGIVIGYICGGRLKWITNVPLHYKPLVLCAISIQLVIFSDLPFVIMIPDGVISLLHIISYILLIAFIVLNFKVPGIPIIGLGALLNSLVIFLNGGYMPSLLVNGNESIDNNITNISNKTLLPWLGDIFPLPEWLPLTNNFSIGDIFIGIGACIYLVINMKPHNKYPDY
jgi:hypothetical protein